MIRQFIAYYQPYRHLFFLDFTSAVVVGLLELGFPLAINQFIDRLLPSKDWPLILLAAAGLLGIGRNTLTRKVQELRIDK